ncbi:MAG: DUF554 domain-containing protein [Spirochaetaceae bacterium]|jgi:uncharacterized membrane protein YqgA involved in biofilm formation|nr:DUF554 domain-containing protein [Spirochaetaceae bacterium]
MLGPLVNAVVIVICALVGAFFVRNIPARFEEILKKAIGLAIIYIGVSGALVNQLPLLLILSLVSGAIIGEAINIDRWFNKFGLWAERKIHGGTGGAGSFSKGFVQASILFCSGAMAIVGSMQSGFYGNHETLFAKTILDGSISIVFGATLGIGVAFSAIPVFIYQGGIALLSMFAGDALSAETIREMAAVGNLVVAAIGFNFLDIKEIRVANFIPAIFIPLVYFSARGLFFP